MYEIDRLVNAGMNAETAFDVVFFYLNHNRDGLKRYIFEFERGQRQRPANT